MYNSVVFSLFPDTCNLQHSTLQDILIHFRTFSSSQKETLHLYHFPILPPPSPPALSRHKSTSCLWISGPGHFMPVESYNRWSSVSVSFPLASCSRGSPTVWEASERHSFLQLNSIPVYGSTNFVHQQASMFFKRSENHCWKQSRV